jgi:hypothetical protein
LINPDSSGALKSRGKPWLFLAGKRQPSTPEIRKVAKSKCNVEGFTEIQIVYLVVHMYVHDEGLLPAALAEA